MNRNYEDLNESQHCHEDIVAMCGKPKRERKINRYQKLETFQFSDSEWWTQEQEAAKEVF